MMAAMDGGMREPNIPAHAATAAEKGPGYPLLLIWGMVMLQIAAIVPVTDPVKAP